MTLSTQIKVGTAINASKSLDLSTAQFAIAKNYTQTLTDGTGAGKADLLFSDTRTILASANDDLDLNGVLTGAFGDVLNMVRVKAIIITAAAANTNDVLVGGAASNQFVTPFGSATDKVRLKPGTTFALLAGSNDATAYLVTPTTGDILRVANGGAGSTVDYDVIIVAASA